MSLAREESSNSEIAITGGIFRRQKTQMETWHPASVQLGQSTDSYFEIRVSQGMSGTVKVVTVPYGLLREAWRGADSRVHLMLDVRLIWDADSGLILEPY
jgi:hypothetical protein